MDVAAVLGLLGDRRWVHLEHIEAPRDRVDGDHVLARVVLHRPREESLREEESGDPKGRRDAVVDPRLDKIYPPLEIRDPRREGLEGRVGHFGPHGRHLVVEEARRHLVELLGHDDEALECLEQVLQAPVDEREESVEALALLREHRIHRLVVDKRVLLRHSVKLKGLEAHVQDALGRLPEDVVPRLARAARHLGLEREQGLAHGVGLVLRAGDVRVLVQAEH
mmetsp:Transcript_4435/g.12879  ORF Transcript_4435/g.12879 Transcript_4435/m.12879 type:complete len:223 (+) Transcript_4435:540-1208(+)